MQILETQNKTFYGAVLDVTHTVISDWKKVWSYEAFSPISKRRLRVYTYESYMKKVSFIISTTAMQDVVITDEELPDYFLCYDWIEHIGKQNWIDLSRFNSWNLKNKAYNSLRKFTYLFFLFICIPIITYWIGYYVWEPNNIQEAVSKFWYDIDHFID